MKRTAANALKLSAVAAAAWLGFEGFVGTAMVPTHGDRPTIGYGSTFWEDGRPVQIGEKITRERATVLAIGELDITYAQCVRNDLGETPVTQVEFDIAADFTGQYGCTTWKRSQMSANAKAGKYDEMCEAYLEYRFITAKTPGKDPRWQYVSPSKYRFDCAAEGNRECAGVWTRQKSRYSKCVMQ